MQRSLWRLANQLAAQYRSTEKPVCFRAKTDSIREAVVKLSGILRRLNLAKTNKWHSATEFVTREYESCLDQVEKRVAKAKAKLTPRSQVVPRASEIFRDLVALRTEFGDLDFNKEDQTLAFATNDVQFSGVRLGCFEIKLHVDSLSTSESAFYEVVAVDPNHADSSDDVTHPHVDSNRLCEGDAQPTIRLALQQGRLLDFFQIVEQVLGTYNPSSAYVRIEEWDGRSCGHCGYSVSPEDCRDCADCGATICDECIYTCAQCDDPFCGNCEDACEGCLDGVCKSCIRVCDECGRRFCSDCLEDERCSSCEEKAKEVSTSGGSETEVLANGVGQAAVPA